MRISDWSSDVCSSDLGQPHAVPAVALHRLALPGDQRAADAVQGVAVAADEAVRVGVDAQRLAAADRSAVGIADRSEEPTSELQSLLRISYAVFCLKTKTLNNTPPTLTNLNTIINKQL